MLNWSGDMASSFSRFFLATGSGPAGRRRGRYNSPRLPTLTDRERHRRARPVSARRGRECSRRADLPHLFSAPTIRYRPSDGGGPARPPFDAGLSIRALRYEAVQRCIGDRMTEDDDNADVAYIRALAALLRE